VRARACVCQKQGGILLLWWDYFQHTFLSLNLILMSLLSLNSYGACSANGDGTATTAAAA